MIGLLRSLPAVLMTLLFLGAAVQPALADAEIPTADVPGSTDNPLVKRYEGSFIVSYETFAYTDFKIPLSTLIEDKDRKREPAHNNIIHRPEKELEVEGALSRIVYLLPEERSPLEVLRNFQDVVTQAGGETLYECKEESCGGDLKRASSGGGGDQSFMMYFFHEADLKDKPLSNGSCAVTTTPADQRFFAGKIPQGDGDAYVTVHTYQLLDSRACKAFTGRTIAIVHVLEPKGRDKKMVVVKAAEMADGLDTAGRVALYGIYFDTDKTALKPESAETLEQIATLLKETPDLAVIIVGHTDNAGRFDYNVDLSNRRAQAVKEALVADYGIDAKRLSAAGVGMMAPMASNDSDDGRAKNRRVELVKLN
ncbi:OmpA family protein [Pararhizobium sp.]|uniref:OmpA family protein n=1 Tax=Pararhizobium sp. TaxID=1977563 RepID=UPI0027188DC9|nr:OmpA family protein [Pararhizobium sp.]MDO9417569.1 OmpA family protein [Pararhizobium sp.]